ncbi:MAG TPA: ABC transporter substrate binding protein [Bryobacteraceae bacterium]|nr:ABC transporter substrate binding protein [Bryobacteraceae bacterium]
MRIASKLAPFVRGLLICELATHAIGQSERVTVVYTSEAGAYTEALEGMRPALSKATLTTVDLRLPNAEAELGRALGDASNPVVITVGKEALERVRASKTTAPLVAAMIMRAEAERVGKIGAAIHLDIPVSDVLAALKSMFPDKTRVAVIRNPAQPGQVDSAVVARGRQQGFTVTVVDSADPQELLRAVRSLNGKVDFIVCLPDSRLYNSATVKPLILASLESHLLIVGFSSNFVRSGAGVGIYPDFRDIGAQAGEAAEKQMAGQPVPAEQGPRRLVLAVNQRVIHLLGLEYRPRREGEVLTFR